MRLKHLWVEDYKNLKDFSIDFEPSNGLTMIIGNNGSGKSNILELISGIFHDAYVDSKKIQIKTHYSLTYEIDGTEYQIKKQGNGRRYRKNDIEIPIEQFVSNNYLPSNIIALYSGEENRLWNDFYEMFYKKYIKRIEDNLPLENMNLVFINKYYWNIALLVILLSSNETLTPFINNELKLNKENVNVKIQFNKNNMHHVVENAVDELRVRINPRQHKEVSFSISDLHQAIYKDRRVDENGIETFEGNEKLDSEVFWAFTQAFMPKHNKVIKGITINFSGLTTTQLSEGEKKLILVKAVLEFLADEKTLILMDEPDAHINEGRKQVLHDIFTEYPNRHIVLTTHSPSLVHVSTKNNLVVLENENNSAKVMTQDKFETLQLLTPQNLTVIEQSIIFNSNKPLVIFEGKTDILYVKQAVALLSQENHEFKEIKVDFLSFNGTGNAKSFIDELLPHIKPDKKIIMFFDRDDAGKKGVSAICEISKDDEKIVKFEHQIKGNIIVDFLPYKENIANGDFLIEDYFDFEFTIKPIIERLMSINHHPIKNLPKLAERVKKELEKNYINFGANEFKGFESLLNKIHEHINMEENNNANT